MLVPHGAGFPYLWDKGVWRYLRMCKYRIVCTFSFYVSQRKYQMKTVGIVAVGIMCLILVFFLITINNWDKKIEQGESIQHSEGGNSIAKFFLYLFVIAYIVFNLVIMKDCSRENNIPFEETIRHD